MKEIIIIIFLVMLCGCFPGNTSKTQTIGLLIDTTVDDKEALSQEMINFQNEISQMVEKGNLGSNIKIATTLINDLGENRSIWEVVIPEHPGFKKRSHKKAMFTLKQNIESTVAQVKQDTKKYERSMILEPLITAMKKSQRVVVLSDLALVNDKYNFERSIFGEVYSLEDLSKNVQVDLIRVGRPGQDSEHMKAIETWWHQAIYGGDSYSKIAEKAKTTIDSTGIKERIFQARTKISRCLKRNGPSKGILVLDISVDENGRATSQVVREESSIRTPRLHSCVCRIVNGISFAGLSDKPMSFRQKFNFKT